VHGGAEDEAVGLFGQVHELVDPVVEDAAAELGALAAGDAPGQGLGSDLEDLRGHTPVIEGGGHGFEGRKGATVGMGAAVDQNDVHGFSPEILVWEDDVPSERSGPGFAQKPLHGRMRCNGLSYPASDAISRANTQSAVYCADARCGFFR
jgi:hypothetical protein